MENLKLLLTALQHFNTLTGKQIIGPDDVKKQQGNMDRVSRILEEHKKTLQTVLSLPAHTPEDELMRLIVELDLQFGKFTWLYGQFEELLTQVFVNATMHSSQVPRVQAKVIRRHWSNLQLEIAGQEIQTLTHYAPAEVVEGGTYPVLIVFTVGGDESSFRELSEPKRELVKLDDDSYLVRGYVMEDRIDAGILLTDEKEIFTAVPEYIGKYVEFRVENLIAFFMR